MSLAYSLSLSDLPGEIWKDIPDWVGLYQASNMGRIKSLYRVFIRLDGKQYTVQEKIRKIKERDSGYWCVYLNRLNSGVMYYVQELILETFVGPRPLGMECRHFPDPDKSNNKLDNISWGTRSQNYQDRIAHGTDNAGERCANSKLTDHDIPQIWFHIYKGRSDAKIARYFDVHESTIERIRNRKTWKHVEPL